MLVRSCDRPTCKAVIPPTVDFVALTIHEPEKVGRRLELCLTCAGELRRWLEGELVIGPHRGGR